MVDLVLCSACRRRRANYADYSHKLAKLRYEGLNLPERFLGENHTAIASEIEKELYEYREWRRTV